MPDNEQSKELFAYFGLAVYYSQALEQQLTNLLVLARLSDGDLPDESEIEELYQRKLGNSFGQLVKELEHYYPLSEDEGRELQRLWKQRNHIVHDYFKERIYDTFTPAGRAAMIRELKRFKNKAAAMEAKLQRYCNDLYLQLGSEEGSRSPLVAAPSLGLGQGWPGAEGSLSSMEEAFRPAAFTGPVSNKKSAGSKNKKP
ncbi:hypothetical protein ACE6ED_00285 [Paenibacillus sp. CN-4]|uniref:hypothetical protein n=1 Tax=Paenibacillus nanchangensis TaxID=3348343 RepID=UPI00397AB78D